MIRYYSKFTNI